MANTTTIFLGIIGIIYLLYIISTLVGNIYITKLYNQDIDTQCEGFESDNITTSTSSITTPSVTNTTNTINTGATTSTSATSGSTTIPITTQYIQKNNYLCYDISDLSVNFARYSSIMFWFSYVFYGILIAFAISRYTNIQPILWVIEIILWVFILVGSVFITEGVFNLDKKNCTINNKTEYIKCMEFTSTKKIFARFSLIFIWLFFIANTLLIPFIAYKYIR